MERVKKLSDGDFKSEVSINSGDELENLGASFNFMTSKIDSFMSEMVEKGRMESELATAQAVQSSLFPDAHIKNEKTEIAGHYESASECGGDWWGCKFVDDKLYFFVGDATGHGVPAALLTATVSSCCNSIIKY